MYQSRCFLNIVIVSLYRLLWQHILDILHPVFKKKNVLQIEFNSGKCELMILGHWGRAYTVNDRVLGVL